MWSLDADPSPLAPTNQSSVDLILKSAEQDSKAWPYRYAISYLIPLYLLNSHLRSSDFEVYFIYSFELRLRVTLSAGKLTLIPRVRNTDSKPFSFTIALRNYLSVSDIRSLRRSCYLT